MRFVVDENETSAFLPPLRLMFPEHDWLHVDELDMGGLDDVDLFRALAEGSTTALITRDVRQLRRSNEFGMLHELGMHWIGHPEPVDGGMRGMATLVSNYTAALPHILELIPKLAAPTAIKVKGRPGEVRQCIRAHEIGTGCELRL